MSYAAQAFQQYPKLTAIIIVVISILTVTRVFTTIRFRIQRGRIARATGPIAPAVPPYTILWLANGSYYLNLIPNIGRLAQKFPDMTAFTFHIAGSRHHVVLAPSMVHQMSTSKNLIAKFSMWPFIYRTMENVWADNEKVIRNMDRKNLDHIHNYLTTMMHSSFLNVNVSNLTTGLSTEAANLVTFCNAFENRKLWERISNTVTTSPDTVVTSLFPLIRTFCAALTTDVFFSPDLLSNYQEIVDDLFLMDTKFELFFAGMPQWTPAMTPAAKARDRVMEQIRQSSVAFNTWDQGKDPGKAWSRIGQTNSVIAGRIRDAAKMGDFDESLPEKDRGRVSTLVNSAILWALQVNATGVIFWMVFYANSDPDLLQQLRDETAPYIKTVNRNASNYSSNDKNQKSRLEIDGAGLRANCKLLTGAFHEVMRMETFAMTYKLITEDIVVSESAEDAAIYHRPGNPKSFALNEGDYVAIPHTLHHNDSRYFPNPEKFDARRFWVPSTSASSKEKSAKGNFEPGFSEKGLPLDPSEVDVTYRTTHPWGGGAQLCKGKKFAEHEVLYITAALLYLWDFTPVKVDAQYRETEVPWEHPGRESSNATARPLKDLRVRVKRRAGVW